MYARRNNVYQFAVEFFAKAERQGVAELEATDFGNGSTRQRETQSIRLAPAKMHRQVAASKTSEDSQLVM